MPRPCGRPFPQELTLMAWRLPVAARSAKSTAAATAAAAWFGPLTDVS
jgi:hypothetical protein